MPTPAPEATPSQGGFTTAILHGCLVAAAAAVVLLSNLGGPALWDEDEPKNAACTMAMIARNDWVVPTFNGRLRIEKPALVNWIQMAGCRIAGANETGVRLGSAALTIGSCLVTWRTGCLLNGPAVGLIAGMVMAGCAWTGVGGRAATPDAPLVFFTTIAFHCLATAAVRHAGRPVFVRLEAMLFGTACGLGVLAKGPVGVVVPLAALGILALWHRDPRQPPSELWRGPRLATIVATAAIVAAPWYAWAAWRTGGAWLHGFFFIHNVERFTSTLEGHSGSVVYYPLVLLIGLFPWSIAAAATAWHLTVVATSDDRPSERTTVRIAIAWTAVWVAFFSCAGTKLPGYVWPAYPAIALLLAIFWNDWRLGRLGTIERLMPLAWASLAIAGIGIGIGLSIAAHRMAPGTEWCGIVGLVPLCGAVVAWRQHAEGNRGWSLGTLAATGTLSVAVMAAGITDLVGSGRGPREIRPLIALEASRSPLVSFRKTSPSLVYYAAESRGGEPVAELWSPETVADHFRRHPDGRLVTELGFLPDVEPSLPRGHGVIARFASLPSATEFVVVGPLDDFPLHDAARADTPNRLTARLALQQKESP